MNALGFVSSPLYLFGHYWEGKPTEWLLGKGVTPGLLNDDRMGRMLDTLFTCWSKGGAECGAQESSRRFPETPFPLRPSAPFQGSVTPHPHG